MSNDTPTPTDTQLLRELANVLDQLKQEYNKDFWVDASFTNLESYDKIPVIDDEVGTIGHLSRSSGKLEFTKV